MHDNLGQCVVTHLGELSPMALLPRDLVGHEQG